MPIAHLPEKTVRAIGSSQVLTGPVSVIKELVDNSLDAGATTIVIEISANALDVIQVKDNGFGIAAEDRSLVCQRYCTSKIRDFEDVSKIGGKFLGFRGEALASAAEMSRSVVVTSKVEGEAVGVTLKMDREGKVISQDRVSHPVGTTIRVVDFLKYMPVRKQTVLKSSNKTPSMIRSLLQGYVLARPTVRFSFKVLKSQSNKDYWMYAPKAGATVTDAALKVVSLPVISQCEWRVWHSKAGAEAELHTQMPQNVLENTKSNYIIESLIPKKHCADNPTDVASIMRAGHYISIDSRPVTCSRGTLKQILSIFKSYIQISGPESRPDRLTDPFLCMNIICPSGSYDPNIEPSKDDVLFTDPDEVLRIIKSFFVSIYGERDMPARRSPQSDSRTPQQHDFDLLLHQRPTPAWTERDRSTTTKKEITSNRASEEIHNPLHGRSTDATDMEFSVACALPTSTIANCNTADQSEQQLSESVQAWKPNMYDQDGFDECNDESGSESVTMIETEDQEVRSRDLEGLNPWTIAKLNAPIKSLRSMGEAADRCDATCKQLLTPARTRTDYHASSSPGLEATSRESTAIFTNKLLSPRSSPTTARPVVQASQPPTVLPFSTNPRSTNTKTTSNALYDPTEQYNLIRNNGQSLRETAPSDGFVSARDLPTGTPLNEIPDISQRPRKQPHRKQHWQQEQGRLNKAFKLPPHGSQACSTELSHTEQLRLDTYGQQATLHLSSSLSLQSDLGRSSPKAATSGDSDSRGRPIHPDLVLTLDFERRKAIATQKRKEFLRQQSLNITKPASSSEPGSRPLTPNSPHRNRYNKAIATLNSAISPAIPPVSIFEPGDPRGNLARSLSTNTASSHHASAGTHKLKRRKTATLPLETVPETEATHELIHTVTTTARTATARAAAIAPYDDYVRAGHLTAPSGLDCTLEEAQVWQATLQRIVKSLFVGEDGGRKDVGIELWPVLQGRRLACAFP